MFLEFIKNKKKNKKKICLQIDQVKSLQLDLSCTDEPSKGETDITIKMKYHLICRDLWLYISEPRYTFSEPRYTFNSLDLC